MGDTCIVEKRTVCLEPEAFVEADGLDLRVQPDDPVSVRASLRQKAAQQCRPDARAAPVTQHGHPTDMAVRKESCRTDRQPGARLRKSMNTPGIVVVPFERFGHVLLDDEDGAAHGRQSLGAGRPGHQTNVEGSRRMHGARV